MAKEIVREPIKKIIEHFNHSDDSIFLLGTAGSGKSLILQEYLSHSNCLAVSFEQNVFSSSDNLLILDRELCNLYYTCFFMKKLLERISFEHPLIYKKVFLTFNNYLDSLIEKIHFIFNSYSFKNKYQEIGIALCQKPELLLDYFLKLYWRYFHFDNLTIILDDFDIINNSQLLATYYQKTMYQLLKNRLRFIMTVSDYSFLTDPNKQEKLQENNSLVTIDYNKDVDYIYAILDSYLLQKNLVASNLMFKKRIRFIIKPTTIKKMIELTNGNIDLMKQAIKELYLQLSCIDEKDIDNYLINILDNILKSYHPLKRELYL